MSGFCRYCGNDGLICMGAFRLKKGGGVVYQYKCKSCGIGIRTAVSDLELKPKDRSFIFRWVNNIYVKLLVRCVTDGLPRLEKNYFDLSTSVFVIECQSCHEVYRHFTRLPPQVRTGVCINEGQICNIGFACDGCPYNPDVKPPKELFVFRWRWITFPIVDFVIRRS
jgi:hypothetical protein